MGTTQKFVEELFTDEQIDRTIHETCKEITDKLKTDCPSDGDNIAMGLVYELILQSIGDNDLDLDIQRYDMAIIAFNAYMLAPYIANKEILFEAISSFAVRHNLLLGSDEIDLRTFTAFVTNKKIILDRINKINYNFK